MTTTRLSAPRIRVVLDDPQHGAIEVVVQADNRDLVRWDITRRTKNWPEFQEAPFLWQTFLAWSVLQREGQTSLKLDAFLDTCAEAAVVGKAGDVLDDTDTESDDATVGPTPPGLASA